MLCISGIPETLIKRWIKQFLNPVLDCNFFFFPVTVVCVPMAIGQSVYRPWIYGQFMCKITGYMQGMNLNVLNLQPSFTSMLQAIILRKFQVKSTCFVSVCANFLFLNCEWSVNLFCVWLPVKADCTFHLNCLQTSFITYMN